MTAVNHPPAPAGSAGAPVSDEALAVTRTKVRQLLEQSEAFQAMPADARAQIARDTVKVASYLAEPDGMRVAPDADVLALADLDDLRVDQDGNGPPKFSAQGAREGAEVAGALLTAVNFPDFVTGLIDGVFHSIVQSSIQQMEAYGKLVADVAKSLNDFRDENVSVNQGRDHLVDSFPDLFEITMDTGGGFFGDEPSGPRVSVRSGVDEQAAVGRLSALPVEGEPVTNLSSETIEQQLVPAARTQLATSRQQLLATMVLMGINRIVVTDGKIQAKVMYDFQAQDNHKFQRSATSFDYGDQYVRTGEGEYESDRQHGSRDYSRDADGAINDERTGGSYYAKGTYKHTSKPVLTLASATAEAGDAALQTRASLAGVVDINFKSDYLELNKLADSFQIAQIQRAAEPSSTAPGPPPSSPAPPPTGA